MMKYKIIRCPKCFSSFITKANVSARCKSCHRQLLFYLLDKNCIVAEHDDEYEINKKFYRLSD